MSLMTWPRWWHPKVGPYLVTLYFSSFIKLPVPAIFSVPKRIPVWVPTTYYGTIYTRQRYENMGKHLIRCSKISSRDGCCRRQLEAQASARYVDHWTSWWMTENMMSLVGYLLAVSRSGPRLLHRIVYEGLSYSWISPRQTVTILIPPWRNPNSTHTQLTLKTLIWRLRRR